MDLIVPRKEVVPVDRPKPTVIWSPHPILLARSRRFEYARFLHNESLLDYLIRTGIYQQIGRQPVMLTINGIRVPREMWGRVYPKEGTLINIYAVVHDSGGDDDGGGKNPIATVAMIALMVVATYFFGPGSAIAAQSAFGAAALYTATVVIGGLVINSVFPPPKPKTKNAEDAVSQFSVTGGSNQLRQNQPFAKIIGVFRHFPDFGAQPYSEYSGNDQLAYFLFDCGYNDGTLTEFKIGDTPLSSFTGIDLQESGPDGVITLFPGNVDSIQGAPLELSVPQQLTTSFDTTSIGVDIAGTLLDADKKGNLINNSATLEVVYRKVGDVDWLPLINSFTLVTITNSTRASLRNSYKLDVPKAQYEVRITLVDDGAHGVNSVCALTWAQLRSYQPDTADYTGRKRIAMRIAASGQLNGAIDQFNFIFRAKTQVWDEGLQDWVVQETANPAWWYLDAARGKTINDRLVYGAGYPDDKIDLENIKAFAKWCDDQNLEYNGQFTDQVSVFDLLSSIALAGRGTISWGTGKLGVVWDAPNQPVVAMFGMQNIIPGTFSISYAIDQLADVIEGQFINPETNWQQDFVRTVVPGALSEANVRTVKLEGITSRQQAAEQTNLYAAQNAYRNRRYKWQTDWEGMPVSRGDVVGLTHDMASLDYSGRFIEGGDGTTTLKLPRKVPLFPMISFILIQRPEGTFDTVSIQAGSGETDTLTLINPLPDDLNPYLDPNHPPYDWKWQYGPTTTPGKKVKIDGFNPISERIVELTAIDELDIFYTAKDNPYSYVPPRPIFGGDPVISDLKVTEEGVRVGNGYLVRAILSWTASGNYSFADVRMSLNGNPFTMEAQSSRTTSIAVLVPDFSDLVFEVTAFGNLGRLGKTNKQTLSVHIDFASISPPTTPTRFTIDGPVFNWLANEEVDVVGYKIRFQYGSNFSIEDAAPLHEGLLTANAYQPPALPQGQVTFMLTAVDSAGLESPTPAIILTDLGDPDVSNVIETKDFRDDGWPGNITGGSIVSDQIVADDETSFYNSNPSVPMYGVNADDPFYRDSFFSALTYETDLFIFASVLDGSRAVLDFNILGDGLKIEYRVSTSGPMYVGADGDPFYDGGDAAPVYSQFFGDEPDYQPWPGAIFVGPDQYQFRVTVESGPVQPVIDQFKVLLDVPDVEETFDNITIASGGTRLSLTKNFTVIKNIQLTLESDGGSARIARYLDKDVASGPLIKCYDSSDAPTGGIVDARVKGY